MESGMEPRFSVFPREQSPGYLIYRAANQMKVGLWREFLAKGFSVTPEQWGVLSALWEADGMHQASLAKRTAKDRHNIARILHLLEKARLVRREKDPEDKRCLRVYLTGEGKALQSKLVPIVTDFLHAALAGLGDHELGQLRRILGIIDDNLAGNSERANRPEPYNCEAGEAEDSADGPGRGSRSVQHSISGTYGRR
jgi:DNA-binding MarR family transcriptional regulator